MHEQLQQALLSILNNTIDAASATKVFLAAEIPDVIRQLLMWKATEAGFLFVVLLIAAVALVYLARWSWAVDDGYGMPGVPGTVFGGAGAVAAAIFSVGNLHTLIQIVIAPKIWLIEYAASLVK